MSSGYNYIYKKLVQGPNDVVGALAYALYKQEKIAYVTDWTEANGRAPIDSELIEFHRMTNMPQRIAAYKQEANTLLQEFLDDALFIVLQERNKEMQEGFLAQQLSGISNQINARASEHRRSLAKRNGFWTGVGQNVVAGVVTTLIAFGFVLAAWMWTEGPDNIISRAWNKYNRTEQPLAK